VLDELYGEAERAVDGRSARKAIREFERRLLDDEVHYLYTLQWHRFIPHSAKVKGWTAPESLSEPAAHAVWLTE